MPLLLNKVFLICRCTRRDYAEDMFYNGTLYFNYPINWIKMGANGDEGQGDLYEGVYANIISEKTKQLRSDSEIVPIKNKLYLRSRFVIENWPCLSFYCISELTEGKKENESIVYDMAKDYIESFSHGESFQSMLEKPLQDRMSMVIIIQTGAFFRKIRDFFNSHGLVELHDFFMSSVSYRDKDAKFVYKDKPYELLNKEGVFKKQQEFRIILSPNNPKVQKLLEDGHKIHVGSLEEMAMLKTNFYNGATIKVKDHAVAIEPIDWNVLRGPLNEWDMESMLGLMTAAYHTTSCVIDGKMEKSHALWVVLTLVLCSKYNIEVRHAEYDDEQNDRVLLVCHSDDIDTIMKNEKRDSYYYLRKDSVYKAPSVEKLLGGFPPGIVDVKYLIRS